MNRQTIKQRRALLKAARLRAEAERRLKVAPAGRKLWALARLRDATTRELEAS